ncbi:putative Multi-sensor signal transduction histidine kinase [Pseudodesulfovibrio profundus]|uniref:histidine kinase n=1 Tax=Pseudodesulfovibrio profundus TaxID=57320 RepID=A0A2C8F8V4_9BACT|nr:ATP-binding protein [Pseudodesulfovibrio profundus]SOB58292.1 putative Multi-sensor signal transduction histidine kinase [Pseudodesulfovibrio profundus]
MTSLSSKIQNTLLATMLAITAIFLAIGIPIQVTMTQNSTDLICFSLDAIARRDNDNLANELFENRNAAITLRLNEILHTHKVLGVALYDEQGHLLEFAIDGLTPPARLAEPKYPHDRHYCQTAENGLIFVKPIRAMGSSLGWLWIAYDMSAINRQIAIYYLFFGGLLSLSIGCMFVLVRWRTRKFIIAPLQELVSVMEDTRAGASLPHATLTNPADEVARLYKTFNDMSQRLYASYTELNHKNAQLQTVLEEKERKALELEESEARFRTIVSQAPVGILLFDNEGTIVEINEHFADIMGAPGMEHILGINMIRDVQDKGVVECVREAIETGSAFYENYYTSISGRKTVYVRVNLLRINKDLLCGVFEDLTKQREMLKALTESEKSLASLNKSLEDTVQERTKELTRQTNDLKKANIRLKELDTLKTSFLSSVSHELRTPLTSILGFAKITLKQFKRHIHPFIVDSTSAMTKAEAIESNLTIIGREGERLSRLVNDVLDMARIESGRMPWNDALTSPTQVVENVISAASGDFQNSKISLKTDIQPAMPDIVIDPDKLFQVIRNLLHNAMKFTEEGSVTVTARNLVEEDVIEIRVQDTGAGIAPADIDSIFDKFHQIANTSDELAKPKGSGLGLSISRQIVEHYRGTIWVESTPGQGATFIVHLPVR